MTDTDGGSRLDAVKAMPRSVSQLSQYRKCPHAFFLQRVERVWQRPAAWLPMGTAVHGAAEAWERSHRTMDREAVHEETTRLYVDGVNELAETTPRLDYWSSSGPYHGEEDIERRFRLAHEHTDRYLDWYEGKGADETILKLGAEHDNERAIELEFNVDLDGVAVRGFIDQVVTTPAGTVVRDIKTGAKPGDALQLATYAVALAEQYDLKISHGDFLMTKTGKPTKLIDLFELGKEEISGFFSEMDQGVKAERFDAKPDPDTCRMCSVSSSCSFSAA